MQKHSLLVAKPTDVINVFGELKNQSNLSNIKEILLKLMSGVL